MFNSVVLNKTSLLLLFSYWTTLNLAPTCNEHSNVNCFSGFIVSFWWANSIPLTLRINVWNCSLTRSILPAELSHVEPAASQSLFSSFRLLSLWIKKGDSLLFTKFSCCLSISVYVQPLFTILSVMWDLQKNQNRTFLSRFSKLLMILVEKVISKSRFSWLATHTCCMGKPLQPSD